MSDSKLRNQTKSWLTAVSADVRRTVEQETARLRTGVEERIAALEKVASTNDKHLDQLATKIATLVEETAQEAVAEARAALEASAQAELSATRDRLQSELDAVRTKLDTTRSALETKLAEAVREASTVRQKRDELASSLEKTLQRLTTVEQENKDATLRRQLAEARLEEELQRRVTIEKQLETSRQELVLAKAEAESSRIESYLMDERMRAMEQQAAPSAPESKAAPAAAKPRAKLASVPRPPAVEPQKREPADPPVIISPSEFAASRRARRVNVLADNAVLVDGVASVLVDISTLGAQILSPATLRPNRTVRLMLKTADGTFTIEGRIVWAQLESPSAQAAAQYRAGMQFTATNQATINAWVSQQSAQQVATHS